MKSLVSTSTYENSASHFFRTTTGTKSGSDTFDKLKLVMTFLTNLGVTEIFRSFRLVLEGKTGKEIPGSSRLEFFKVRQVYVQVSKDKHIGIYVK